MSILWLWTQEIALKVIITLSRFRTQRAVAYRCFVGNGLWDASNPMGNYTRKFYHQVDVDVLTNGNHELYNGTTAANEFLEMIPYYEGRYVAVSLPYKPANKYILTTTLV